MDAPPILPVPPPDSFSQSPTPTAVARWRLWLSWVLLASYPLVIAGLHFLGPAGAPGEEAQPVLPGSVRDLLILSGQNLFLFGILAAICWALARPGWTQLRLNRWPGFITWLLAFGYSVGVRLLAAAPIMAVLAYKLFQGEKLMDQMDLRSKVENVVAIDPLSDPVYLLLATTLISFVVAGLREELWRAGVIAIGEELLPRRWSTTARNITLIAVSAAIFGLGHLQQGAIGVVQITIVGAAFGSIIVYHRSTWLAVIAHGFFDAATFVMLRLLKETGELEKLLGR